MPKTRSSGISPRYFFELFGALLIYAVVLFSTIPIRDAAEAGPEKLAWSLVPVIPLILVFWAIIRQYNRFDELMQKISAEAFALGAMAVGWGLTVWSFGENGGWAPVQTIWIAPALIGAWGLSMPIVMRKYR